MRPDKKKGLGFRIRAVLATSRFHGEGHRKVWARLRYQGLSVAAEIAGEGVAQAIQLSLEYAPAPPFDSGHPDRASAAVKDAVFPQYERARAAFRDGLARASIV